MDININEKTIPSLKLMNYRTLYVLKGREDPSEHVKTN